MINTKIFPEGEEVQMQKNREGEEKMAARNVWSGFYGCQRVKAWLSSAYTRLLFSKRGSHGRRTSVWWWETMALNVDCISDFITDRFAEVTSDKKHNQNPLFTRHYDPHSVYYTHSVCKESDHDINREPVMKTAHGC